MMLINSNQLAFVLEIKVNDARAKMCYAYAKEKGIDNEAEYDKKGKIVDPCPPNMDTEMLSRQLNVPDLEQAITDIRENYLKRPAAKKWILCDYPEKEIKKATEAGKKPKLAIPKGLRSLLPQATIEAIKEEWQIRFPKVIV